MESKLTLCIKFTADEARKLTSELISLMEKKDLSECINTSNFLNELKQIR